MIIIVEGPDGAGKSTLIRNIAQGARMSTYTHFGAPESDEDAFGYYKKYAAAIKQCKPEVINIFDRSWYSDMVYGPIMRSREEMTQEHADMLSSMVVAAGGGIVVYCTAPVKTLWSRCRQRGETYIDSQATLSKISQKYAEVMRSKVMYLPVIRYDTAMRW